MQCVLDLSFYMKHYILHISKHASPVLKAQCETLVEFIVVLIRVATTWRQLKCPLTNDLIKKMHSIYMVEYYSAIKKNGIMSFAATWMDLEIIILSIVS